MNHNSGTDQYVRHNVINPLYKMEEEKALATEHIQIKIH